MPGENAPTFRPGAPCWADVMTSDVARTQAFYGALFGWGVEGGDQEQFGGYFTFVNDGVGVGGGMPSNDPNMPDVWSVYLWVVDAAATVEKAVAAGGTVFLPAMEVGSLGSMAVVGDPGGAAIGMWQPGEHTGFGALDVPGAPTWFELHTNAYDAAVKFYEDVFGWESFVAADEPDFKYTTFGKDDDGVAGIMDASAWLAEGVPPHWGVYWFATDADATFAEAVELGATPIQPVEDTPYGKLASLLDPTGAMFKIRQPPG